jgi:capsule polysaccharide export protein KpsC/LpsZ
MAVIFIYGIAVVALMEKSPEQQLVERVRIFCVAQNAWTDRSIQKFFNGQTLQKATLSKTQEDHEFRRKRRCAPI